MKLVILFIPLFQMIAQAETPTRPEDHYRCVKVRAMGGCEALTLSCQGGGYVLERKNDNGKWRTHTEYRGLTSINKVRCESAARINNILF